MTFRRLFRFAALLIALSCLNPVVHADSWMPPKPSVTYESASQDARFIVTSSARPEVLFSCKGTLYVKRDGAGTSGWVKRWDKPLQNQLSPVTALVAGGGWRVVTFDNYYSVGFGEEVVVIYDEKGDLLKKYSLESLLSEAELSQVPRSVSSRWWRSRVAIDEPLGLLRIEVAQRHGGTQSTKSISFNLMNGEVMKP